jgi:hypothetical protein
MHVVIARDAGNVADESEQGAAASTGVNSAAGGNAADAGTAPLLAQLRAIDRELWELQRVAAAREAVADDGGSGEAVAPTEVGMAPRRRSCTRRVVVLSGVCTPVLDA